MMIKTVLDKTNRDTAELEKMFQKQWFVCRCT